MRLCLAEAHPSGGNLAAAAAPVITTDLATAGLPEPLDKHVGHTAPSNRQFRGGAATNTEPATEAELYPHPSVTEVGARIGPWTVRSSASVNEGPSFEGGEPTGTVLVFKQHQSRPLSPHVLAELAA